MYLLIVFLHSSSLGLWQHRSIVSNTKTVYDPILNTIFSVTTMKTVTTILLTASLLKEEDFHLKVELKSWAGSWFYSREPDG